jgi:hypothetical protein
MFTQARVLYVITTEGKGSSDRGELIYDALKELELINYFYEGKKRKEKINILSCLPSKTIFSKSKKKFFVSLPFMSSHFSIPVNIDEHIWVYSYNLETNNFYDSFWLSRVHSLFNVENQKLTNKEEEANLFSTLNNNAEKIEISTDSYVKIDDLCLKGTNNSKILFSGSNEEDLESNTGEISITSGEEKLYFLNSSSSLLVTERLDKEYISSFFTNGFFIKDNIINHEKKEEVTIKNFLGLEKESLLEEKLILKSSINIKEEKSEFFVKDLPAACMSSTNIMLLSENNKEINSGGIYLIKNNLNSDYSEMSLRKDGKIFINSDKILIGNLDRRSKESLDPIIYLGYNEESSSIVKGEYLKSLLLELIGVNKEALTLIAGALDEIKDNFKKVDANYKKIDIFAKSHFHISNVPSLNSSPSTVPLTLLQSNVTTKIEESSKANGGKEIERLQDLVKNIDKILSKFVKTV